jgi:hypothetical protein
VISDRPGPTDEAEQAGQKPSDDDEAKSWAKAETSPSAKKARASQPPADDDDVVLPSALRPAGPRRGTVFALAAIVGALLVVVLVKLSSSPDNTGAATQPGPATTADQTSKRASESEAAEAVPVPIDALPAEETEKAEATEESNEKKTETTPESEPAAAPAAAPQPVTQKRVKPSRAARRAKSTTTRPKATPKPAPKPASTPAKSRTSTGSIVRETPF